MVKPKYKGCVYRATLIIGNERRCYIGKSTQGVVRRRNQHYSRAQAGLVGEFSNALRAYERSAFSWQILFMSDEDDLLKAVEIQQIALHRLEGWYMLNHTTGGDGASGRRWTAEYRASRVDSEGRYFNAAFRACVSRNRRKAGCVMTDEGKRQVSEKKKAYWRRRKAGDIDLAPPQ